MSFVSFLLREIALVVVLFVCFALGSGVAMRGVSQPPTEAGSAALAIAAVCVIDTLILSYLIVRSRWAGVRLMLAIFVVFYGVATFMPQIESAVFLTRLPPGLVPRFFVMGLLISAPFSVLAVIILGKRRVDLANVEADPPALPVNQFWKLAVIAVVYVILYFSFGYFIAWQNPAVRQYYGGTDPGGLWAQMRSVVRDTPWLVPFQIFRGLCWAAIALPMVRMLKGDWREIAFAVGITFALLGNVQLLLPNPYMPEPVRMAHLLETASSNFIFGVVVGWLLMVYPDNVRDRTFYSAGTAG